MREPRWSDGWYRVPHEVTWRDLDGIGHVNNAVFFTYFEWARSKYWLALRKIEKATPESIEFIVARAECDFVKQLGLAEQIEIGVRIGEIRNSSFDFEYELWNEAGEVAARGLVVAVLFDWASNGKIALDGELRSAIEAFQGERVLA